MPAPRRGRRLKYLLLIALTLSAQAAFHSPYWRDPQSAACHFALGFAQLRAQLGPTAVGVCLGDETFDPAAGVAVQPTVRGLLVWRKTDGGTAFSDGHRTWVAGPYGLQQRLNDERFCWESGASPGRCLPPASGAAAARPGDDIARLAGMLVETLLDRARLEWDAARAGASPWMARALSA